MGKSSFRARRVLGTLFLAVPAMALASACSNSATTAPPGEMGTNFGDGSVGRVDAHVGVHPKDAGHKADTGRSNDATLPGDAKTDGGADGAVRDGKAPDGGDGSVDGSLKDALAFTDAVTSTPCKEPGECASNVCAPSAVVVNDAGHAADAGNCATATCTCQAPSCADGVKNGTETGVDCGGTCPNKCVDAVGCLSGDDCVSGVCGGVAGQDGGKGSTCQAPSCTDGVKNGTETAVDCGSNAKCPPGETCQTCPGCTTGENCAQGGDCTSGICTSGSSGSECACPTGMTEASTNVGLPYCIDSYEVTFAQYNVFTNLSVAISSQPPECSWNHTFLPQGLSTTPGTASTANPVTNVNWCDAYMYCANTGGKHLCGTIATPKTSTLAAKPGGLPVTDNTTTPNDETVDEWYNACTNQGTNAYPYGSAYNGFQCNGIDSPAQNGSGLVSTPPGTLGSTVDVTSPCILDNACNSPIDQYRTVRQNQVVECHILPPNPAPGATPNCGQAFGEQTCGSLTPGLFDMSGNVAEWENSCNASAGASDTCLARGGSFDSANGSASLTCATSAAQPGMPRNTTAADLGFRCCL